MEVEGWRLEVGGGRWEVEGFLGLMPETQGLWGSSFLGRGLGAK